MKICDTNKQIVARKLRLHLIRLERLQRSSYSNKKHLIAAIRRVLRYHRRLRNWQIFPTLSKRLALLLQLLIGSAPVLAQMPISDSEAVLVNTHTPGFQGMAEIAMNAGGNSVKVWSGPHLGADYEIFAQRFDIDGLAVGDEILVNTNTVGWQLQPKVALDADGDFVVAWGSSTGDGSSYGVFFQRFDSQGNKVESEQRANAITEGLQEEPDIAMLDDGRFVIVWEGSSGTGISTYYRRYDADGVAMDTGDRKWQLGSTDNSYNPEVAMAPEGGFVIACQEGSILGQDLDVHYELFDKEGDSRDIGGLVHEQDPLDQDEPNIAIDDDGDFTIVWQTRRISTNKDVSYRRFASDGSPLDTVRAVPDPYSGFYNYLLPSIAMDIDGDMVICYGEQYNSNSDVYLRALGLNQNGEIRFKNVAVGVGSSNSNVAMDARGNFDICWSGEGDGDPWGVYGKRYREANCDELLKFDDETSNHQVAMDASGGFTMSYSKKTSIGWDLYVRRYDSSGQFMGQELVLDHPGVDFTATAIACDRLGNFVVIWVTDAIYYRGYNANGSPVTPVGILSSLSYSSSLEVDMNEDGNYLVLAGSKVQRMASDHIPIGDAISLSGADVAMDDEGDFVTVWSQANSSGYGKDVYGRLYQADGTPKGNAFEIASGGMYDYLFAPQCAMDSDGNFTVMYTDDYIDQSGNISYDVYSKSFSAIGESGQPFLMSFENPSPPEKDLDKSSSGSLILAVAEEGMFSTQINLSTSAIPNYTYYEHSPRVAMDADGDFVVIWAFDEYSTGDNIGCYRRFESGNCQKQEMFLGNEIGGGIYHAGSKLRAIGNINDPQAVHFKAGNEISLEAGFQLQLGATLVAEIENCP